MRIRLDPDVQQFLDRLTQTTRRMERAHREISSGKRFTAVSDAPDQVSTLLQSRLELEQAGQIKQNLARVQTEVDTAEAAIASTVRLVERARVLAGEAAGSLATPEQIATMAIEAGGLLERAVGAANTTVEGRFIFSGDRDDAAPFALDLQAATPVSAYAGLAATRETLGPDGATFRASRSGDEVFTPMLNAIENFRAALLSGDRAQIATAQNDIFAAEDHLRVQHAWYGTTQARVRDSISGASARAVRFETQVGALEDADVATAVVEFQKAKMQREASLQAQAQVPRRNLFDYLG